MKVITLKPHGNCHGDTYEKQIGDVYENPNPQAELTLGNVEHENDSKAGGDAGNRTEVGASESLNSKKQDAESSKGSGRTYRKKG